MKKAMYSLIVLLLTGFSLSAQNKTDGVNSEKTYTIDNCINELTPDKVQKTKVGYQFYFVDKDFVDGRTLKMSAVGPHLATHAPHRHAMDEFYYILEGTAEVYLNGETKVIKPNTSFYCPPNSEHGIRNVGDTELRYLVIKKEK